MWTWTLAMGLALAGPWDNKNADVSAWRELPAAPHDVYLALTDLPTLARLMPQSCAQDWEFGEVSAGLGATASVTYRWDVVRRRLNATLTKTQRDAWLDLDHAGSKGFVTRFTLEPKDQHTRVTVTSYVNPPPWPLKGRFFQTIQPIWTNCYVDPLANLELSLAKLPPPVASDGPKPPPSIRGATWISAPCEGRGYIRRVTIQQDFTYSAVDLIAPCPPTARCTWSGTLTYGGKWHKEDGAYLLREEGEVRGEVPHPTKLVPQGDVLIEQDAGSNCRYELME